MTLNTSEVADLAPAAPAVAVATEAAPSAAVAEKYGNEETDEFLKPLVFGHAGERRVRDGSGGHRAVGLHA